MPAEEKPFVCTRNGVGFNIMPRNRTGWLYLALWTLPALAAGGVFSWVMSGANEDTGDSIVATSVFVLVMLAWAAAMARWMYVRSEVIDVRKLLEEKRARDGRKP